MYYINRYMTNLFRPRTLILFVGDLFFFAFALWLSLSLRTFSAPSLEVFVAHLVPFSFLFVVWVGIFFIAGLYESRSILLARRAVSLALLVAQTLNIIIAALFFFFIPVFGISPKTILIIYLAVSFLLVFLWRVLVFPLLGLQKPESAIVVGDGMEVHDLVAALARARNAPVKIVKTISPASSSVVEEVEAALREHNARYIIADFNDPRVATAFPEMYNLLFRGVRFFDAMTLYEEVFGRIPLSILNEQWLARNVSRYSFHLYDSVKRGMDVVGGVVLGVISLIFYPFIAAAIKIDDGGPIFISQVRVGQDNKPVRILKFRTMSGNDNGKYDTSGTTKLRVTRVGRVLRITRLDELPQLWSVVIGDLSLIGPRLEFPSLVQHYEEQIPYYGIRHLIKPGLSGWAQLYYHADPHHSADVEATKMKLAYDLYYLKHRSLTLDLIISIKTIRRVLMGGNA